MLTLVPDPSILATGSASGSYLGLEFANGAWQVNPFDTKDNAFSLCTWKSNYFS
jgi:hypothetical protein